MTKRLLPPPRPRLQLPIDIARLNNLLTHKLKAAATHEERGRLLDKATRLVGRLYHQTHAARPRI
jgi:hypothetical protein